MIHDNHEVQPGYDPRQIWKDGCQECADRAKRLPVSMLELDGRRFFEAWRRAYAWEHDDDTSLNLSEAERPLLKQLWVLQLVLERFFGWPMSVTGEHRPRPWSWAKRPSPQEEQPPAQGREGS